MLSLFEIVTWLLFCIVTVNKAVCHPQVKTVCVQCGHSVQDPSCNITVDCHHLENLQNNTSNFTIIEFQSRHSFLHSKIHFENFNNLTILGANGSTIICNESENAPRGGIEFFGVSNLIVKDLQFTRCGVDHYIVRNENASKSCSGLGIIKLTGTLFLFKSNTVTFDNVHIRKRNGTGVIIFDTTGLVTMNTCTFENKQITSPIGLKQVQRGRGVYVKFGHCSPCVTSGECAKTHQILSTNAAVYRFSHCKFQNNIATVHTEKEGGGLAIIFEGNASNITISIDHCEFINNSAVWGGGLKILFKEKTSNNSILINASQFFGNTVTRAGGGLSIKSLESYPVPGSFDIYNCIWSKNLANIGAAVDNDNVRTHLTFQNCSFVCNSVADYKKLNQTYRILQGKGALYSYNSTLTIKGIHTFSGNNGSALYLTNSAIKFQSGSDVQFLENSGINGGAMYLDKQSHISVMDNINVSFFNNTAVKFGGAIFQDDLTDNDNLFAPLHCLFDYNGDSGQRPVEQRNISFFFRGNHAGRMRYNAIFVPTLRPCGWEFSLNRSNECFSGIGSFKYDSEVNGSHEVSTKERELVALSFLEAIPGKKTKLPVELRDELHQKLLLDWCQLLIIKLEEHSAFPRLSSTMLQNCSETMLYGVPGQNASLLVKKTESDLLVTIPVYIQECPPGYIFNDSSKNCICSATANNLYEGIEKCNESNFAAYLKRGYWVGYDGNETETEQLLIVANCPYCHSHGNLLPIEASRQKVNKFMCGPQRTGVVCGKCVDNHTTLFHGNNFECYQNTHYCKYGILFYILSEWMPVTVLFILVIVLNISFTTGAVNGFVFFVQFVVSTHSVGYLHLFDTTAKISRFSESVLLVYRMFNLDFFSIQELSFCLWRGAGALDVLVMKYVTVIYSFVLVVLTILAMRICKLPKFLNRSKKDRFRSSVVHGLSSFLIMCYSQCARISIDILTSNLIKGKGDIGYLRFKRRVVFYDGEIEYFHTSHLPYAIPALFFTLTLVLIPPILLTVYPLCYKVFEVLKINENKVALFCRFIPLERIRPLFDSMQSCYKDSCRFFSGLYFFYRVMPLITFAWTKNDTYYGLLQFELIIVFGVHSIVQPYKIRWHNWIDSLLFVDLLFINGLSIWKYLLATGNFNHYQGVIVALHSLQTVLTLLPLVYLVLYLLVRMMFKLKAQFNTRSIIDDEDNPIELSPWHERHLESSEDFSVDYQKISQ